MPTMWLMALWTAAVVVLLLQAAQHAHGLQCERITVPACQGLGYNMTALPNLSGHEDQTEAEIVLNQLQPLLDSDCSRHVRFVVCAAVFPLCTPDVSRPVAACRSLCQSVRNDCAARLPPGTTWPALLDCETLPQPERQELCMQVPQCSAETSTTTTTSSTTTTAPATTPAAVESLPTTATATGAQDATAETSNNNTIADTNATASIEDNNAIAHHNSDDDDTIASSSTIIGAMWPPSWANMGGLLAVGSNSAIMASSTGGAPLIPAVMMSPVICAANFTPISATRCGPVPGTDALFTAPQKRAAGTWTLALAALCFILTLFSLVTFWAEPMRFGYPERPVLFLALCYNLLSVAYLERAIFHQQQHELMPMGTGATHQAAHAAQHSAAHSSSASGSGVSAVHQVAYGSSYGSPNGAGIAGSSGGGGLTCPASFMLVGYLQLAAAAWWFLFAVCWYLSTVRQWSSEALERRATLFHVLAWCPAAVPPMVAILWDAVRPNELTGMCAARGFVEWPAAVLLVTGAACIGAASRSLGGMRRRRRSSADGVSAVVVAGATTPAAAALDYHPSSSSSSSHQQPHDAMLESSSYGDCEEAAAFLFHKRLAQIRQRICVFSAVFFVPAVAAVVLGFVETGYATIEACVLGDPCLAPKGRWPVWPTLLRLFVTLAGGSLTGMWVWSKKTCESYRSRMQQQQLQQDHQRQLYLQQQHQLRQQHSYAGQQQQQQQHRYLQRSGVHSVHNSASISAQHPAANGSSAASAAFLMPVAASMGKYQRTRGAKWKAQQSAALLAYEPHQQPQSAASSRGAPTPLRTTTQPTHVGPLYAGISFQNVPVYGVRPPTTVANHNR